MLKPGFLFSYVRQYDTVKRILHCITVCIGENHFNLFGTLPPRSKNWGHCSRLTFNCLEAVKPYDSLEQITGCEKQKSFKLIWEYHLCGWGKRNWGVGELWYAIVPSPYLKSNNKGGCSGNLAEESGNAGVVMLGSKSMKKRWFLKPEGAGRYTAGRERWNARAVKGQALWKNMASGTARPACGFWVVRRPRQRPAQLGILLCSSAMTGFQEHWKRVRALR